jgi:uncharacterized membrane protein YeaQ/YmgE (transglycosylase-associated protein family)
MLLFILTMIIVGLIAGAVARLLVPGRDPMSIAATIVLGIVGSFVGGFLFDAIFKNDVDGPRPANLLGSIIGAVIALLVYRAATSRGSRGWGFGRSRGWGRSRRSVRI